MALTLRLLCGLSTAEVARAFLVSEPTMAARITRAKKKIAPRGSRTGCRPRPSCPSASTPCSTWCTWCSPPATPRRPAPTWCAATSSNAPLDLARMLHALLPDNADVAGLLALILLTDARRATRVDAGRTAAAARRSGPLAVGPRRDRARAPTLVAQALRSRPPGRYALQAAIAAVHAEAPSWDGHRLGGDRRRCTTCSLQIWPSPVVALNRAVAVGFARARPPGWPRWTRWPPSRSWPATATSPAARAEFLRRLGRVDEARARVRGGAAAHRERGGAAAPVAPPR